MFPAEHELWTPESRLVAAGRSDQHGQFTIIGLPPGRYLAAAVEYLELGEERNPELLDRLTVRATQVTLQEGESKRLNLALTVN